MGRPVRAVLVGARKVGKTAIASQFACSRDITNRPYVPSTGDSYVIQVEHDKTRDHLILIDTAGLDGTETSPRSLLQPSDFILLVCSLDNPASFAYLEPIHQCVEQIQKEKKDLSLIVLINHWESGAASDSASVYEKQLASVFAWCQKEKLRCFNVDPKNLKSVVEPFKYLIAKYFSTKDSRFSLPKKSKEKGPGAAILLDF